MRILESRRYRQGVPDAALLYELEDAVYLRIVRLRLQLEDVLHDIVLGHNDLFVPDGRHGRFRGARAVWVRGGRCGSEEARPSV